MRKYLFLMFIVLISSQVFGADLYVDGGVSYYANVSTALAAVTGNDTIHIIDNCTEPGATFSSDLGAYDIVIQFDTEATVTFQAATQITPRGTGSITIKDNVTGQYPKRGKIDFSAITADGSLGGYANNTISITILDIEIIGPTGNYYTMACEEGGISIKRCYLHDFGGDTAYGIVRMLGGNFRLESCYLKDVINSGDQNMNSATSEIINNTIYSSSNDILRLYTFDDVGQTISVKNNIFIVSNSTASASDTPILVRGDCSGTPCAGNWSVDIQKNYAWGETALSEPRVYTDFLYTGSSAGAGLTAIGYAAAETVPFINPSISNPAISPEISTTSLMIGRAVSAGQTIGYNGVTYQNNEVGCWALGDTYSTQYISVDKDKVMVSGDSFCDGAGDLDESIEALASFSGKTFIGMPGDATDGICMTGRRLAEIIQLTTERLQAEGPGTVIFIAGFNDIGAGCNGEYIGQSVKNIRDMVADLTNNKTVFIYAGAQPDAGCWGAADCAANAVTTIADATEAYIDTYCSACASVDTAANFKSDAWNDSGTYYYTDSDRVHPNSTGFNEIASTVSTLWVPLWDALFGNKAAILRWF